MIRKGLLILLWYGVWLLLCWPVDRAAMLSGIPVALLVHGLTDDYFLSHRKLRHDPLRFLWFFQYLCVFLWECAKANLDVAYRVIHPNCPIRPGTVKVKINIQSETGLTFLANSLTLTPGNTTIDVDRKNGIIYVHRLTLPEGSEQSDRLPVAEKYEKILRRIFE